MRSECDPPRAALRNDAELWAVTNVIIDLITGVVTGYRRPLFDRIEIRPSRPELSPEARAARLPHSSHENLIASGIALVAIGAVLLSSGLPDGLRHAEPARRCWREEAVP